MATANSETARASHIQDQRVFHHIVNHVANHPAYTSPLPRRERKPFANSPLKKALSPVEQAYLRAHTARREAYGDAYKMVDEAVTKTLPPYPDSEDERLWGSQTAWASRHSKAMASAGTAPEFIGLLKNRVEQRTGDQWLGFIAEKFLTRKYQPHLYARAGALALYKEFQGQTFHMFDLNDVFSPSLDNYESDAVRHVLVDDGVLSSDKEKWSLTVNPPAIERLSEQQVYVPPHDPAVSHHS